MVLKIQDFLKKIIVILSIFMVLISFVASSNVEAASSKTQISDGFYYSGTTEGTYVVTQSFWDWLIEFLGQVLDFLIGLFTMGGRMVFVGWTALIEELVTMALEATSGIPMEVDASVNPTAVDGAVSSSNNVTLEAIVYNKVPILNVNLFSDNTVGCVSGTGNFFVVCETCYNEQIAQQNAANSAPDATSNPLANSGGNMYAPNLNGVAKKEKICEMTDCSCTECWQYMADAGYLETDSSGNYKIDTETGKPIRKANAISIVKESVSKWYYIIRLIAIIGMLIVLLAVGIKMLASSIASDKALYKRMLVDWVAGMILLFLIHYYMVAVIATNEMFIGFIQDVDNNISEIVKKEFYISDKDNSEYEIGIYQAVRTRAYDAKLTNGTTGTVLYITLVFTTVKFVITYLKRYLSVIILTLMAPGIAFSYAIQKVLSGKSKAFSTWMHEYFITVFIQTVHALVYTVFVSTALEISLNSIAGMIIAFVFMNFMLKADDIFRKIFKMTGGSADEAMNAPESAKGLAKSAKSAVGMMTAGSLLKKSPITKAVTAPLRNAGAGALLLASKAREKIDEKRKDSDSYKDKLKEEEEANQDLNNMVDEVQDLRSRIDPKGKPTKAFADYLKGRDPKAKIFGLDGKRAMEEEIAELQKLAMSENVSEEDRAAIQALANRFDARTTYSGKDIFKAGLNVLLDKKNFYEYDSEKNKYIRKKEVFDKKKNKWVKASMSKMVAEQLKSTSGITDEDKALLKEVTQLGKSTLLGMGSLIGGLGTVVTNPGVGFGLLATGTNSALNFMDKTGMFDHKRTYRAPTVDEKHKKFSFNRFNKGAKQNITKSILENVENEKDEFVVENVRKNHKTLYRTLKIGGAGLVVAGAVGLGATAAAPIMIGAGVIARVSGKGIKRYSGYSQNSLFGKISRHHFKKIDELEKEIIKDGVRLAAEDEKLEMEDNYSKFIDILAAKENADTTDEPEAEGVLDTKRNEVLELESGEVLKLDKTTIDPNTAFEEDGYIKDKIAKDIIEKAVAKVIVDKALSESGFEAFNVDSIKNSVEDEIVKKLVEQDIITKKSDVKKVIKDLDSEIKKSAEKVIETEVSGKDSSDKLTAFDEAIVESVVREKVESGEIKKTSDISETMIIESVKAKREAIIGKKSSDDVIKRMQDSRTTEEGSHSQSTFESTVEMTEEKESVVRKQVSEIKKKNKPKAPRTEEERRKDTKKRIEALDDILTAVAKGEDTITESSNEQVYKSVDEVIQELFENTAEEESVYALVENVKSMKRINIRGDNAKINSNNRRYLTSKKREKERKAFEQHPEFIPTGDREYTNGDGRKDISKETYGPVTDVVSLIEEIKNSQGII